MRSGLKKNNLKQLEKESFSGLNFHLQSTMNSNDILNLPLESAY